MGFFSKKDYVCEKCGKSFQKRFSIRECICDECQKKEEEEMMALEKPIQGYIYYANNVLSRFYTNDEMRTIIERKSRLLEKFKNASGITREELQNASDNYRKLTDEQATEILGRVANSTLSSTVGASYSGSFFVPTCYEGMIVDAEDVFAVGYTTDYKTDMGSNEMILCAIFTNDPYIPVFPMIYVGKLGIFDFMKGRKGRAGVNALFEAMCPNLTYPVGDIKQLKKQIKQEKLVRGKIDITLMLDLIGIVSAGTELFDTKKMHSELLSDTRQMLDQMGYIPENDINEILHMDKMFNRNFWKKQMDRMIKQG